MKKKKAAVTLQDSLDVNKEALAKVCKCHDMWSVFFFTFLLNWRSMESNAIISYQHL